jgi:Rrf2 family protein
MITREADYCIRTVLHLSKPAHRDRLVPVEELAREMEIPVKFLRKILSRLIEGGIVISHRGRNGGLSLKGDPSDVSLLDVLKLKDDKAVALNLCLTEEGCCAHQETCTVHEVMKKLQIMLEDQLKSVTFEQLV